MPTYRDLTEDAIKARTWDLPLTLRGLLWAIGVSHPEHNRYKSWRALTHFRNLVAYQACPPDLRADIERYVGASTPEPLTKFNPHHDNKGEFASTDGYTGGYADSEYPMSPTSGGSHTDRSLLEPPKNPGNGPGPSRATVRQRNAKVRAAMIPSKDMIQANLDRLEASPRPGDDLRGNSKSRKVRTQKLLQEFGDGKHCPCVWCGCTLDSRTMTQDKIYTLHEGGRYNMENILPSCLQCNQSLGAKDE